MIAIIGGGPAGLCAAIEAAGAGTQTVLFEKKDRVGKKLLATGNGRCNISNEDLDLRHFHTEKNARTTGPEFIRQVFSAVSPEEIMAFWHMLGLELTVMENGKMFPMSLQASSVLDALRFECERRGVRIVTETEVTEIRPQKNGKKITGYTLLGRRGKVLGQFDRVLLSPGGKASPQFGSDGTGIEFAKALKLGFVPLRPAIVRLSTENPHLKALAGCKIVGEAVLLQYRKGKQGEEEKTVLQQEAGEILFNAEGLSGPPILNLAREALAPNRHTVIALNLFPQKTASQVFLMLKERCARLGYMTVQEMLSGILNKRLILPICKTLSLEADRKCAELGKRELSEMASLLNSWTFPVSGDAGWKEAQVTVGGIAVDQLDPQTMELSMYPGLHAAGEVMDVDGDCGGYNITWAAATGILAGRAMSSGK